MTAMRMVGDAEPIRFKAGAITISYGLMLSPIGLVVGWACGWDEVLSGSAWVLIVASFCAALYGVVDVIFSHSEAALKNVRDND